jgi:2-polyprenyl-3-methyl-5-hydroxy-6-metoxy-1,4-benzoquinol methylase
MAMAAPAAAAEQWRGGIASPPSLYINERTKVIMVKIDWDALFAEGRDYKKINVLHLKQILHDADIATHARVLDVGCGTGDLARKLGAQGMVVTGVDSSDHAIKIAQQKGELKNIDFRVLDADQLSALKPDLFELITFKLVVAFLPNVKDILTQALSLLSENGKIVIITPVRFNDEVSAHYKNISVQYEEFSKLLHEVTASVQEINKDYADEAGMEITFLLG